MRRSLTLYRSALTAAATLALLTACGGDSGGSNAASSSTAGETTASSESTAPEAGSAFCTQADALIQALGGAFAGSADSASLPQTLQRTADSMRGLDAPAEISADWSKLADGMEQYAVASTDVDFNDPASTSQFQQRTAPLQAELTTSAENVGKYLTQECGIDTAATESASPTS